MQKATPGLKNLDPDGFIRQGRVLGGESKTIPDGGYAKLTLRVFKAKGMPMLLGDRFSAGKIIAFDLIPDAGARYAQTPGRLGLVAAGCLQCLYQARLL
jgi:hypothetical protein